jgi:hypothetical protein
MSTPVSAAPTLDPRAIQNYHIVAVSTTGVRTPVEVGPNTHQTYAEAQAKATAAQAALGTTVAAVIEIWPSAPPCHNPNNQF